VKQALGEIDALLAKGGSDKTKILSAVIWLRDIGDFAAMNTVWDAWVVAGQTPARATVQARLNDPAMKVEIMVVAAIRLTSSRARLGGVGVLRRRRGHDPSGPSGHLPIVRRWGGNDAARRAPRPSSEVVLDHRPLLRSPPFWGFRRRRDI
jgi:hypothetical protein